MKKHTNLLWMALLLAAHYLPAQNLLLPLLQDSSHYHYTDPFSGQEQYKVYSYYHYDSENLPLSDLFINYFGSDQVWYQYDYEHNAAKLLSKSTGRRSTTSAAGPWENWLKDEYTYDAQNRNTYYFGQFGNASGGWDNYYQETFWFDDNAPADSSLYELWSTTLPGWENYRRNFNYYLPAGDLKKHLYEEWKSNIQEWLPLNLDTYTYYPDGKVKTTRSVSYDANQESFVRVDSFVYRPDGKVDSTFSTSRAGINGAANYFIAKSEYDSNGNLILKTTVSRDGGIWVNSSQEAYAPGDGYYSNDYSYENQSIFNVADQEFEVIWEIIRQYTPYPNNRVLYREERKQRNGQGVLVSQIVDSIWYHLATVGTNDPGGNFSVNCQFSNPFRPGNSIVCNAPDQNTMMQIRITNISGQIVAQGRVMPGEAWRPGNDWPAGPYFLSAWQNGKYLGSRKMVVSP